MDKAIVLTSALIRSVGQFSVFFILAKTFDPHDFGIVSLFLVVSGVFALIGDFGSATFSLPALAIADRNIDFVFRRIKMFRLATTVASFVIGGGLMIVLTPAINIPLFVICCLSTFFASLSDFSLLPFRALRLYKNEAMASAASTGIYVLAVATTAALSHDLFFVALALLFSRAIAVPVVGWIWRRSRPHEPYQTYTMSDAIADFVPQFKESMAYFVDGVLSSAINFIDSLLVGFLLGPTAVGLYQIPTKIFQANLLIIQIAVSIYVPSLARQSDASTRANVIRKMLLELAAAGLIVAIPLAFVVPLLIDVTLGKSYEIAQAAWVGFGVALFFRMMAAAFGIVLIADRRPMIRVKGQLLVVVSFVLSTLLTANTYGISGVAWSLALSMALAFFYYTAVTVSVEPLFARDLLRLRGRRDRKSDGSDHE